ncbi:MAG: amidohydrolase [Lutisporaceae bacterium]|jgi:aminobenzoyl-glutamate utilization protein A
MFERINQDVFEQGLIALRREFHNYPELCWTEFRTTARIIEELEKLGLTVQYGPSIHKREKMFGLPDPEVLEYCWQRAKAESTRHDLIDDMRGGYTGCLTVIEGALPGPTIGIRVDIDCNELQESVDQKHRPAAEGFSSVHNNCMHACGHDAHAAIGIGTAQLLCAYRDQLRGKVILVFQPGEEGLRGAASLTAAGHFSQCDYFFSAHVGLKNLRVGTVAASAHGFMASTKFDVTFKGVSAHSGASPEEGRNALAAAATAVLNMLAIPRHHEGASRINIGHLNSGTARNIIPADATLMVETRGATSAINDYMEMSAKRICKTAADMYECSYAIHFMGAANGIECDPPLIRRTEEILAQVDGVDEVLSDFNLGGCEDVTTIMREVQSHGGQVTELIFGMPLVAPHHNNFFDIDERVIAIGARCFAQIALMIGD